MRACVRFPVNLAAHLHDSRMHAIDHAILGQGKDVSGLDYLPTAHQNKNTFSNMAGPTRPTVVLLVVSHG